MYGKKYLKKSYEKIINAYVPLYQVLLLLLIIIIYWLSSISYEMSDNSSEIIGRGVGVFWDPNADNVVDEINWGTIIINENKVKIIKNISLYIKNEYNKTIILGLNTTDWNPSIFKKYISLDWDYNNTRLEKKEIKKKDREIKNWIYR